MSNLSERRNRAPTRAKVCACAICLSMLVSCRASQPQAPVITRSSEDLAVDRLIQISRCQERDLYLELATRERAKRTPMSGFPIVAEQPGDSPSTWQQRYEAAQEREAKTWKAIAEQRAKEFEALADEVMKSGPFGDFGGPTPLEIWQAVHSGRGGSLANRSRIENYRPNSVRYAKRTIPPLRDRGPDMIHVSTPDGIGTVYRVTDDYYIVSPPK